MGEHGIVAQSGKLMGGVVAGSIAIAEGKDINYEGGGGSHEFDAAGDVAGVIVEMTVENGSWVELGQAK